MTDGIHKDRHAALAEAIELAGEDAALDGDTLVTACQGPPVCDRQFDDDADLPAEQAKCPWCTRITVHADGTETRVEPTRA